MDGRNLKNPYPGLRPFEQEDSDFFFGRETHTEELLRRLSSSRFVAVVGTSGSGKSSLVRAGLIPALYGDLLAAGSHWHVAIFRPGDDPIMTMAEELHKNISVGAGAADGKLPRDMLETTLRRSSLGLVEAIKQTQMTEKENLLMVVDQFEELFRFQDRAGTLGAKDESAAFVKLLLEGVASTAVPVYALITMRSDFLGDCARFRDLPEAINKGLYLVPRLTRDQLREAIEGPAAVAGGKVSPALVERLLNEIGDDQDQLPVLQHALMRTWRPSGTMGLQEYEATGGTEKALSKHADEALSKFSTGEQIQLVRKVFQCITEKGPDKREVRRPTQFRDIRAICGNASDAQLKEIIEWFRAPGKSFLMPPDPTPIRDDTFIDISHESLIRKWEMLKQWVDEESESADTYRRLAHSAELHTKGQEGLWRDPGLQLALEQKEKGKWNEDWGTRYAKNYSEASEFLEKSRQARESEVLEKEKQRRKELKRTRTFAAVLLVAFIFAALVAAYAVQQKRNAEVQQGIAEDQRQSAINEQQKAQEQKRIADEQKKIAEGKTEEARRGKDEADRQRKEAEGQKSEADKQRKNAEIKQKEANEQKLLAESQGKANRQLLYVANMNLAGKAFEEGSLSIGHEILNRYLPSSAIAQQDDARSFYWYFVWRMNHQELATLKGHANSVSSVAFSNDGKTLASGSRDNTVKLWDVATRQELATLKGHAESVSSVAFSNDGKTLASGSSDRTIKLWDVATRQELATLKGHGGDVSSVAFSNDGKTLASGSRDNTVKLWDVATRQELATLKGHAESVSSVAFSNDGKTLASGSRDGTIKLWDVATRQELATLKGHAIIGIVLSVAFSNDGKTLASGSSDGTIKLWDVATRQELATLKGHANSVSSVAFSNDGKTLASGSRDNTVKLWDVATRQELATLKGHAESVSSVAFSNDGKTLASGSSDNTVKLWDVATRQELATLRGHGGDVSSVAFSNDGKTLASGSSDRTIKLWDVATRQELATLKGHAESVSSVAFSNDGKTLASGSRDNTVKLWDVATRQELATLRGHADSVLSVAFSNDGKTLASGSGSRDNTVKLWDVATRQELATLKGDGFIFSVAFSNDGKTLASGSSDRTIKLWDVATRQELATLKGHAESVSSVAFSNDGKTLASGSRDNTVKLWDVATRQELATLRGHAESVSSVAFSNDGKTLASGGEDRTVKLWDAASEKQVAAQR